MDNLKRYIYKTSILKSMLRPQWYRLNVLQHRQQKEVYEHTAFYLTAINLGNS